MFEGSTYDAVETSVGEGDLLVLYSDGITEAENPQGEPFEEAGLERFIAARGGESPAELAPAILQAVEAHARDSRFTGDLTVLILKRAVQR
jgi:phosphoserine phosphatase RsbU/P